MPELGHQGQEGDSHLAPGETQARASQQDAETQPAQEHDRQDCSHEAQRSCRRRRRNVQRDGPGSDRGGRVPRH
jgi:hypothetical protein